MYCVRRVVIGSIVTGMGMGTGMEMICRERRGEERRGDELMN